MADLERLLADDPQLAAAVGGGSSWHRLRAEVDVRVVAAAVAVVVVLVVLAAVVGGVGGAVATAVALVATPIVLRLGSRRWRRSHP